jgi:hypothetical protein
MPSCALKDDIIARENAKGAAREGVGCDCIVLHAINGIEPDLWLVRRSFG